MIAPGHTSLELEELASKSEEVPSSYYEQKWMRYKFKQDPVSSIRYNASTMGSHMKLLNNNS
jgi:hypothetical protein